jgi:hypothetical protein
MKTFMTPLHRSLSFPKIISGHTDDAGRTEWAWRQWFRIAGPPVAVAHPCPMINACGFAVTKHDGTKPLLYPSPSVTQRPTG